MKRIQLFTIITTLSAAIGALAQVPSKINEQQQRLTDDVFEVPHGMAVFTNSGTWTRPPGVHRVHVKLWGGGGGGGVDCHGCGWTIPTIICEGQGGLGGGGGGYCEGVITVTGDGSVTVGSGGAAVSAPPYNESNSFGGNGGNSSFLSLTADGGSGGWITCQGFGGSASGGSLNVTGQPSGPYNGNGGNAASGVVLEECMIMDLGQAIMVDFLVVVVVEVCLTR